MDENQTEIYGYLEGAGWDNDWNEADDLGYSVTRDEPTKVRLVNPASGEVYAVLTRDDLMSLERALADAQGRYPEAL